MTDKEKLVLHMRVQRLMQTHFMQVCTNTSWLLNDG